MKAEGVLNDVSSTCICVFGAGLKSGQTLAATEGGDAFEPSNSLNHLAKLKEYVFLKCTGCEVNNEYFPALPA